MNVNLEKLQMHSWFEDEEENIYPNDPNMNLPDKDYFTYHSIFPCTYTEQIDSYMCHPEYLHENNSLYQALLHFRPFRRFMLKRHRNDKTFKRIANMNTSYGSKFSQDCIVSMVNSGDYTLEEAIFVYCNSCERCMNVLLYKYLNGADGYKEYSEEWKKCNTVCEWCKGESE